MTQRAEITSWNGVSVVVPVYGDGSALAELVARSESAFRAVSEDWEFIFVNDGSVGPAWDRIRELAASSPRVRGIDLVRNFGQHNALLAGIRATRGEVVVTMDDDLQHPPEEMLLLIREVREGADLVYGTPREQAHNAWRNATSVTGKAILSTVFGASMAQKISAFRAFRGNLRRHFEEFRSPYVSIDVLLSWGAVRVRSVAVRHDPRRVGQSHYTLAKLVRHWLDMVVGFSTWPLRAASLLGFVFLIFGGAILMWVLGRYVISGDSVPGFPFLACIVTIFSGVQLFSLGVIGEYLARMYVRALDRPPYVIESQVNLEN